MPHPKLDFFRFELSPQSRSDIKCFKDFAIKHCSVVENSSDSQILAGLLSYIEKRLDSTDATDEDRQKRIDLITDQTINKYLSRRPATNTAKEVIDGVIQGGNFGLMRILVDGDDRTKRRELKKNDSVLSYFYFLLYLPLMSREGCAIVHSNGADDSSLTVFREFIQRIFKAPLLNKPKVSNFAPKEFQEEFRREGHVETIKFRKDSFVATDFNANGIQNTFGQFKVTIEIEPISSEPSLGETETILDRLKNLIFGQKENPVSFDDLDTSVVVKNKVGGGTKTFDWDTREREFAPVIYLDQGRITKFNEDGTPDFGELQALCYKYLEDYVIPELRPDKDVRKV